MGSEKLTKAQRKALDWIGLHEPVGAFPADGPRPAMVRKLCDADLVERCGKGGGMFGFVQYRLTPAGRSALSTTTKGVGDE